MKYLFFFSFTLFLIFNSLVIKADQTVKFFELSRLEIHSGDKIHPFTVEIAETSEDQAFGLQYRKSMAPGHGMLFNFIKTVPVSFWMKDTYIPLDILFISGQGKIIKIAYDTVPLSLNHINSISPVKSVLELLAGSVNRLNIKVGDTVLHPVL